MKLFQFWSIQNLRVGHLLPNFAAYVHTLYNHISLTHYNRVIYSTTAQPHTSFGIIKLIVLSCRCY